MGRAKKVKFNYYTSTNEAGDVFAYSPGATAGIKSFGFYSGVINTDAWGGSGVLAGVSGRWSALDDLGNYYITLGTYVYKYNSVGTLQWSYNRGVNTNNVCVDNNTYDVYISHNRIFDSGVYKKVTRINSSGVFQFIYDTDDSGTAAGNISIDSDGNVYAGAIETTKYIKKNKDGTTAWTKTLGGPVVIGSGGTGAIYVDSFDNSYTFTGVGVYKFDSSGTQLLYIPCNILSLTDSRNNIICDNDGNIIIWGRGTNNFRKYSPTGTLLWQVNYNISEGRGMDVDPDNNVYTAQTISGIRIFKSDVDTGSLVWQRTATTSPLVINTRPIY